MGKKAAQAIPNLLLRRARLERGWTQKMVAERIGAPNDVIVTRWERGTAFPSPHYVQRLCELFEQPASELGLIKDSQVAAAPRSLPRTQPAPANTPENPATRQNTPLLSALPLIGRDAEMRALEALYRDVQQGQMQVVLIQGDAGIGKTRLASAFLNWAAAQGATLLTGRAFEMGGRLPYQPLVHALSRRLEEEQAPEALLSATWLGELSRILPELRERYPFLPELPGDESTARIRLFEAVTRLGQAFCDRGPVVIAVDDVQWADAASLDVLHYAGQRWRENGAPVLMLFSLRTEAVATAGFFSKWLSSLHHDLPVTTLTLGPLTLEQTLHLLNAIVHPRATTNSRQKRLAHFGQWLFQETGGQPFYLVETLRELVERRVLRLHATPQGEKMKLESAVPDAIQHERVLPPGVRRLILWHLERLAPEGHALLMASAILGQEASLDRLCHVAEVEERDAPAALDQVLRHGLLREVNREKGTGAHYLPGHDKIREVIATEMSEAQRQLLHRRALAVLKAENRPAAELAHHALAAGLAEEAIGYSLTAGDEAVRLFANAEAQLHYTLALDTLSQLPETAATQRIRVEALLKLIQVSWMAVDVEQTLERLAQAEALAQTLDDHRELAHIHYWVGVVYGTRNAMRQARAYAERVLAEAQELGDEELTALASLQLSRALVLQGQFGPVEGLLTPIIPVLERTANWRAWTDALGYLGAALAARGECAAGLAQGRRAVERARQAGELTGYHGMMARHFLSAIYLYSGDFSLMLEENDQVVVEAQQIGDWLLVYWAYIFRAWAQCRLERHDDAMQSLARAHTAANRLGGRIMGQDILEAVMAETLLAAGQEEAAIARAQAAIALNRDEVGGSLSEGIAERVWGQALAQRSRWEEAEPHLAASINVLLAGECRLEAARSHVVWGLLCRDQGDRAAAQAHLEQAAAQFEASGLTREHECVQRHLAHMAQG